MNQCAAGVSLSGFIARSSFIVAAFAFAGAVPLPAASRSPGR